MVPGMEIFFRRLGEAFCADGVFRLTFIEVGGKLAAGTIGFVWGGTSYLYNSAFDRSWGTLAPGMVLVGEDIRLAIEQGCSGFDLLKGDYRVQVPVRIVPTGREAARDYPLTRGFAALRERAQVPEHGIGEQALAAEHHVARGEHVVRLESLAGDERELRCSADDRRVGLVTARRGLAGTQTPVPRTLAGAVDVDPDGLT